MNVWDAEYAVSIYEAKRCIEQQFPKLSPVIVDELGKGFDNTVYVVNNSYVFRFPRRKIAVSLLQTENTLLPALAPLLPISISYPLFFGKPTSQYPWPFTGYHYIQGHLVSTLSREERILSASLLGEFLRILHDFPVQQARHLGVSEDQLARLDVGKRKPKLLEHLQKANALLPSARFVALEQWVKHVQPVTIRQEKTLCHGDLHIRNVVLDDTKKIAGIIDWGDVHIGHPAVDLSFVYSYFPSEGRQQFFTTYGEIDHNTATLAKFKGLYTTIMLLLYAIDQRDEALVESSLSSIDLLYESL
ncbi:phosphotransferase [Priestia koreensis]|nr:phosphotransferase [Priestia koreensis]